MVVVHKAEIFKLVTEMCSMRIVPVSHLTSSSPSLSTHRPVTRSGTRNFFKICWSH